MRFATLLFATTSLLATASLLCAQPSTTDAKRQAILDYKLDLKRANQLITAMTAMTKYVASLPDFKERAKKSAAMTPAEQIAQVENNPKAVAICKDNGLTVREYLIGVPTLTMAILVAKGRPPSTQVYASPANVAFVKANLAELQPKWDAANGLPATK
jgi:hypothetical protein